MVLGILKLVVELFERLLYIAWYGTMHLPPLVIPIKRDVNVPLAVPFYCYSVIFLERPLKQLRGYWRIYTPNICIALCALA